MTALRARMPAALLLCALAAPVRAGVEEQGAGARALGMGEAFAAVADDAAAMQFNPAGLAGLARPELAASYARLFMGLDDGSNISHNHIAYAQPLGGGGGGRGVAGISLADLRLSGFFSERALGISYARAAYGGLYAGGTLKLLERSFDTGGDPRLANDPLFTAKGNSARAFGLDAGLLYRSSGPLSFGLGLSEINEPDLGLGSADPVRRGARLGLAYRPLLGERPRPDLVFASDLALRGGDWDLRLGGERWFKDQFAARLGLGFGSRADRDATAGASYRGPHFQLDYAFALPLAGVADTAGSHRFSLTVRFGREPLPPPEPEAPATAPYQRTPLEMHLWNLEKELKEAREDSKENQEILKRLDERMRGSRRAAPDSAPAPAQPKPPAEKPKIYTVVEGDTLQSVAQRIYGDQNRWVDVYRVNQSRIGAGGKLRPGQSLVIP